MMKGTFSVKANWLQLSPLLFGASISCDVAWKPICASFTCVDWQLNTWSVFRGSLSSGRNAMQRSVKKNAGQSYHRLSDPMALP